MGIIIPIGQPFFFVDPFEIGMRPGELMSHLRCNWINQHFHWEVYCSIESNREPEWVTFAKITSCMDWAMFMELIEPHCSHEQLVWLLCSGIWLSLILPFE